MLGDPVAGALVARTDVSVVTFPAPVLTAVAERFPKGESLVWNFWWIIPLLWNEWFFHKWPFYIHETH